MQFMGGRGNRQARWIIGSVLLPFAVLAAVTWPMWGRRSGAPVDAAETAGLAPYRYPVGRRPDPASDIAFYRKRLASDPTDAGTYATLARLYLREARLTNDPTWFMLAEQFAHQSLSHQPYLNDNAQMVIARVLEAKHDFRKALDLAADVLRIKSTQADAVMVQVTCYLGLGRVREAAQAADRLVHLQAGTATFTVQALVKETQGDDGGVLACLHQAFAREEPGDLYGSAWARVMFGRFFFRHGHVAVARGLYQEALRIMPDFPLALQYRGELETACGEYDQAVKDYSDAYDMVPLATSLSAIAWLRHLQGDEARRAEVAAKAEAMLRRDIRGSPLGHGRDLACLLLERHAGRDVEEARTILARDVKNRRDWLTLDAYAWSLQACGRPAEALAVEQQALACGIHSAQLVYRMSELEAAMGRPEAAARHRRAALEYDPGFVQTHARVPFML